MYHISTRQINKFYESDQELLGCLRGPRDLPPLPCVFPVYWDGLHGLAYLVWGRPPQSWPSLLCLLLPSVPAGPSQCSTCPQWVFSERLSWARGAPGERASDCSQSCCEARPMEREVTKEVCELSVCGDGTWSPSW